MRARNSTLRGHGRITPSIKKFEIESRLAMSLHFLSSLRACREEISPVRSVLTISRRKYSGGAVCAIFHDRLPRVFIICQCTSTTASARHNTRWIIASDREVETHAALPRDWWQLQGCGAGDATFRMGAVNNVGESVCLGRDAPPHTLAPPFFFRL